MAPSELKDMTLAVCDIAKSAGSYIREERKKFSLQEVERKHAHDYVSYVDKGSETLIVAELRRLLPEAGFITEEGSASHDSEQFVWVIDPLDGTAYMNGKPLQVSQQKIEDALICLQLPYNSDAYKPLAKHFIDTFYGRCASIRMCGSAAMALCNVAAGRLDGYAEQYIGQWDYMAGSLIVIEAGGTVTDYTGSTAFTQGNSVIATNGLIQQDFLNAIANCS